MTVPRYRVPRAAHCDSGALMATAALTVASIALAASAAALWLWWRSQPGPFVWLFGRLTEGTQATVTVKPVTPPKPSQPSQPREEPPS